MSSNPLTIHQVESQIEIANWLIMRLRQSLVHAESIQGAPIRRRVARQLHAALQSSLALRRYWEERRVLAIDYRPPGDQP